MSDRMFPWLQEFRFKVHVNLMFINPSSIIKSDPQDSIINRPSAIKPNSRNSIIIPSLVPKRTLEALLSALPERERVVGPPRLNKHSPLLPPAWA